MFRSVFDHSPTPTALTDLDGRCLHVNQAIGELTGYAAAELLGTRLASLVHPDDAEAELALREQLLAGEIASYRVEQRYAGAAERSGWWQQAVGLMRDEAGLPSLLVIHLEEISERRQQEEQLRRLADYDSLTGLRNRRVFEDDLDVQISRCKRYGERAALLLIDVDDFKQINDGFGHGTGDKVLSEMAAAIVGRIRSGDVAARLGGDEFAVLLAHVDGERAATVLRDLRRLLGRCAVDSDGAIVRASASIGAALLDESSDSGTAAMHEADLEMYRVKRARQRSKQRLLARQGTPVLAT